MIIVLQRVSQASVMIDNSIHSSIQKGFVALVGFQPDDSDEDLAFMLRKITNIRIFDDEKGALNKSISDINGDILLVPNFTLAADTTRGNSPGFSTGGGASLELMSGRSLKALERLEFYPCIRPR